MCVCDVCVCDVCVHIFREPVVGLDAEALSASWLVRALVDQAAAGSAMLLVAALTCMVVASPTALSAAPLCRMDISE